MKPDPEALRRALTGARSWSEVLRRLGLNVCSYNIKWVRECAAIIGVTALRPDRFCAYRACCRTLPKGTRPRKLYCSLECHRAELMILKVQRWLETGDTGCMDRPSESIRSYLLVDQGEKCAICGNANVWMGRPLRFVFDHIDVDSSNNPRENVRLICANCDSQLDTYKGRNRGNGRFARRQRYADGRSF